MTERQRAIMDHLETAPACTYGELASLFDVSTMTIRRDAGELARAGTLIKTLGGVQRAPEPASSLHEGSLLSRMAEHRGEKQAIARAALGLVEPGTTVFLDGSSTCLELARLMGREAAGLTVLTNSLMVCRELAKGDGITIIGLGGEFDRASLCFVGASCEEEAGTYSPDLVVVSTKGFIPREGTFESFLPMMRVKRIMARNARRVVLLVDHSKFGRRALRKALDTSLISDVVTDRAAPAAGLDHLRRLGKYVRIAEAAGRSS